MTGVDGLKTVLDNISFMRLKGFKIELNFVATKIMLAKSNQFITTHMARSWLG